MSDKQITEILLKAGIDLAAVRDRSVIRECFNDAFHEVASKYANGTGSLSESDQRLLEREVVARLIVKLHQTYHSVRDEAAEKPFRGATKKFSAWPDLDDTEEAGVFGSTADLPRLSSWPELIDSLLAMYHLADDWDGQGAKPPLAALVRAAILLAQDFQAKAEVPADRCIAGVNGTIFFEWHGDAGNYREIEVETPETAALRVVTNGECKAEILQLPRQS